jgi:hypothetical protein
VTVEVDRVDKVGGIYGFAVVKLGAFADFEGPGGCIRSGLPALHELRDEFSIAVDFGDIVVLQKAYGQFKIVLKGSGIE